jgi:hypothetical protein
LGARAHPPAVRQPSTGCSSSAPGIPSRPLPRHFRCRG